MAPKFTRLIRFEDSQGKIHFGEAGSDWKKNLHGQKVPTYKISDPFALDYCLTGDEVQVEKVVTADGLFACRLLTILRF